MVQRLTYILLSLTSKSSIKIAWYTGSRQEFSGKEAFISCNSMRFFLSLEIKIRNLRLYFVGKMQDVNIERITVNLTYPVSYLTLDNVLQMEILKTLTDTYMYMYMYICTHVSVHKWH